MGASNKSCKLRLTTIYKVKPANVTEKEKEKNVYLSSEKEKWFSHYQRELIIADAWNYLVNHHTCTIMTSFRINTSIKI